MQETLVWSLIQENPTCCGAAKPICPSYWACALEPGSHNYWVHAPQLLKPACPKSFFLLTTKSFLKQSLTTQECISYRPGRCLWNHPGRHIPVSCFLGAQQPDWPDWGIRFQAGKSPSIIKIWEVYFSFRWRRKANTVATPLLLNKRSYCNETYASQLESSPHSPQPEKSLCSNEDSAQPKIN